MKQAKRLKGLEISYIDNESFHETTEDAGSSLELIEEVESGKAEASDSRSNLPSYLSRLCSTPLLDASEERELFRRMNYCKSRADTIRKRQRLTASVVSAVEDYLQRAERARNYLVQANTRLVMSIARGFADDRNSFDELLSHGISSLMHAVEKFDYDRGYRFSTYATCVVRRDLYRVVMGTKRDGQRYSSGADEALSSCTDYRSEDQGISEAAWSELQRSVSHMMRLLDDRERVIVSARFGFGEEPGKTSYSRLGERLGISKERVRQLANRALDKLRKVAPEYRLEALLG